MQGNRPGLDEMYCTSCGSIVKRRAELCMSCGVRVNFPQGTQDHVPEVAGLTAPATALGEPEPTRRLASLPAPLAVLVVLLGSLLGLPAVFQVELPTWGPLAAWLWAPVAEEVFKPFGVYVLLVRWPATLSNRAFTALLGALAGLSFGLVESTIYMTVYFPDHTQEELVIRYTVPVMLHVIASFIYGLGINQELLASIKRGGPFHFSNWFFFLSAIVIHGVYNIAASISAIYRQF